MRGICLLFSIVYLYICVFVASPGCISIYSFVLLNLAVLNLFSASFRGDATGNEETRESCVACFL